MRMNRTYNFQVDNGLFVVEHMIKKDYKDITVDDLRNNVEILTDKIHEYNKMSTLSSTTHFNTSLTQLQIDDRHKRVKNQLNMLLDNIGNDKNCMICGEKRVNISADIPYSSLMYGLASHKNNINMGNNLSTVDVCPVCLFLSLISFLNTQKISFPFLYMSDSDEFMRDITDEIQLNLSKNILLDRKIKDLGKSFLEEITNINMSEELYDDLGYINMITYKNAQNNYYAEINIEKDKLIMLMKIKNKGLMDEFYTKRMFRPFFDNYNLIKYMANTIKYEEYSMEIYELIRGYFMTQRQIELVELVTNRLLDNNDTDKILKDLFLIKSKADFKKFLINYSREIPLVDNLSDMNTIIENNYDFKDYIILNIQMKGDK